MKKVVIALVAVAVLAGIGVGGWFAYSAHREKQVETTAKVDCEKTLSPLSRKLGEIDSRVTVGMNQVEMHELVSDAAVVYGRIDIDRLTNENVACLYIAVHFENAYQDYVEADDMWSECIQTDGCDVERDKIDDIREQWSDATDEIASGNEGLKNFEYSPPI